MSKLNKKIKKLHKEFTDANGHEPKFADVVVKYDGEDEEFSDLIKLRDYNPSDTSNDKDDANVLFYADGVEELLQLNSQRTADFIITDINGFTDVY